MSRRSRERFLRDVANAIGTLSHAWGVTEREVPYEFATAYVLASPEMKGILKMPNKATLIASELGESVTAREIINYLESQHIKEGVQVQVARGNLPAGGRIAPIRGSNKSNRRRK